ncbi:MAG TPA: response regulator [Rhodothermales bacterium]|nr:response regulator [Rhodothermales bacterium]
MTDQRQHVILLAEDDPDDQMFARKALGGLRDTVRLEIVYNGEQLLQYLRHEGPYAGEAVTPRPDVILLDLNMPRMSGREALRELKRDPAFRRIPVIVLTTSKAQLDIVDCYDIGSNAYVVKPLSYKQMCTAMDAIGQFWFNTAKLAPRDR